MESTEASSNRGSVKDQRDQRKDYNYELFPEKSSIKINFDQKLYEHEIFRVQTDKKLIILSTHFIYDF